MNIRDEQYVPIALVCFFEELINARLAPIPLDLVFDAACKEYDEIAAEDICINP